MTPMRIAKRSAVTLLELMLVMVLLVALAGIAIPTFESMVGSRRLGQSIEKLRNEIMAARVTAMRTGQAQVMRMTLQGQDFSISPWLGGTEAQDASAGATLMQSGQVIQTQATTGGGAKATSEASEGTKKLSEGVTFSMVETLIDSRNALAIQQGGGTVPTGGGSSQGDGSGLSSPLLLYPDGSSTTAQIILTDERGRRMALQLRGVTGQMKSMRLASIAPTQ
jgi:Tfp pilus assembly protein FimT